MWCDQIIPMLYSFYDFLLEHVCSATNLLLLLLIGLQELADSFN